MNLLFRLIWTLVVAKFRSPIGFADECRTPFRVWFTDLDVLIHMNNGKYFSLMDLARTDLMIRAGAFSTLSREGIYPVVASESIKFKSSLKLFQKFYIDTKVVGWDERNFYLEQKFMRGDKKVSQAVIKAQFLRKSGGRVEPVEIMKILSATDISLKFPDYIVNWNDSIEEGFRL